MTIVAGEDDDLIIDLDDDDSFLPDPDVAIEDRTPTAPKPSGLPDDDDLIPDDDEMFAEPTRRAPVVDDDDDDDEDETTRELAARDLQVRETQARSTWEMGQIQAQQAEQQIATANLSLNTLKEKLDYAQQALVDAREMGNTRAEIDAQNAIEEIRNLQREFEVAKASIPNPRDVLEAARQKALNIYNAPAAGKKVGEGIQASNPLAVKFSKLNPWMGSNAKANQTVIKISNDLMAEGKNPNAKSFYAELARRVAAKHGDVDVRSFQAKAQPSKAQRKSPVAPVGSSSAARPNGNLGSSKQYRLTVAEQQTMRRHNLDPRNPTHQKYWAKSRIGNKTTRPSA